MPKILITGGPVHAHLDDVKIVTNRFRGGLMSALAYDLSRNHDCTVTYLTSPGAVVPDEIDNLRVIRHQGFNDYREQVLALSPLCTDVILGAAVANLIPANPIKGKFPSHNYKEGDIVSLDFVVTPRVITQVKAVAPKANLFGFKLLSGASHQELMSAAWHTLISSRATAVVANDARDLQTKFVRTKEGAVHPMANSDLAEFLWGMMQDEHYSTTTCSTVPGKNNLPEFKGAGLLKKLIGEFHQKMPSLFVTMDNGLVFGTAALRNPGGGFWTTGRGKRELDEIAYVQSVDHENRRVFAGQGKASLNAPLLDAIFRQIPGADAIVHGHVQDSSLPTLPYAQPGTDKDSDRTIRGSFNIDKHGCFYVLSEAGEVIPWTKA